MDTELHFTVFLYMLTSYVLPKCDSVILGHSFIEENEVDVNCEPF